MLKGNQSDFILFFLNKVKKGGERVAAKLLIMAEKIINTILI